jgi:Ca-activated chloride channel family protein
MPESATAPNSGLFTTQAVPVPLAGVSIDAEITTFCARVAVTQRYVNKEPSPIEATYVFPLDEGAAVCGFEAVIDGTLVVGEVKEREEAFRMYDDAMERGDGAFLLDEERPDVFQASIGNLPPGREVLVKLTYVTELVCSANGLRFTIPTTVSPRYAPAEDRVGVGRPDAEALNPPRAFHVPYGLQLSVKLDMGGTISRVESPSHPVSVTMNGAQATVALSSRDAALDCDFVLSVEVPGLDVPQAWTERGDDGAGAIAVAFVPTLGSGSIPCDITFLVDRSGSMEGTSIEEVRNALQLCLRSMIPGCRFNIVGFGEAYESLFPQSRAYDDASLAEASAHVAALQANLGGTEILPALQFVLGQGSDGKLPRQIVVLTDGEVTNTDAVIALAKSHAAQARIFTFGIGAGASHHLVNGLARAGGGTSEFIAPGERIEAKVMRQFERLLSPALTNVCLDWGGVDATPATRSLPPVFSGGRLLAYALAGGITPSIVRLSADSPSGPLAFDVAIDPSRTVRGRTVATLAARARIRELEESPEWTSLRGSRQSERKASRVRQEIVALAVKYGLMSRETSYVAIERRETPVLEEVKLRRVPIATTKGWGGLERLSPGVVGVGRLVIARAPASMDDTAELMLEDIEPQAHADEMPQASRVSHMRRIGKAFLGRGKTVSEQPASQHYPPDPPMYALITLQQADGSWDLSHELSQVIGRELADLEAALDGATGRHDDIRRAWATALALAWLRDYAPHAQGEWRLLAAKATRWLDRCGAKPSGGGTWIDRASSVLAGPPSHA